MEKICIYPEQGAEITAYERALNCLIFMLVYLLAGILCMFLPVIFGMHVWHIGWCVAAGSFFWTAILLWKKRNIYEEQVTEMTNSVIAIEDETLRCYQAVGNVYESCWIHFSDITDVMLNKKKQAFLIQITEDQKSNKKRNAVECWYECSKCGHTFIHGFNLNEHRALAELPARCPHCERKVLYWM